jgi:hypothetical protein
MIKELAIITNTHSKNSDLWEAYIGQIQKYMDEPLYFFTDQHPPFDTSGVESLLYDATFNFRTQFLQGLVHVNHEFCLYMNEDYLLYDNPDKKKLSEYIQVLRDNPQLSFIRLGKGIDHFNYPVTKTLNYLDVRNPYFYSQTATLWKTNHLKAVHVHGPDLHIGGEDMSQQFEVAAHKTCYDLGIQGMYHYDGESKRGEHHYDSNVFPYTASALVKGKWCSEYKEELLPLLKEYEVDLDKREWT